MGEHPFDGDIILNKNKNKNKGTNKYADTGCAGCGSLEHNYTECSAQRYTKKQARETLFDLGRRSQNLTQGPTSPSSWPRSKESTTDEAPLLT